MTRLDYRGRRPINTAAAPAARGWGWVTHAAFALALAVVVARLTTTDVLREPWSAAPGGDASGHGPGAATGVALDLLAAVPALLVLARRAVDRTCRVAAHRSGWLLLLLTLWMAASALWSADRFAAVVSACHFAGGACLLWAASQLVRSWDRFRVVAAVSLGLLLALTVHTVIYRFNDVAETRQYWAEHKAQFLHDRGWADDSFAARQFERKLLTGEQAAFFASANTLAATGVLLAFAAVAVGLQRAVTDRDPGWLALTGLAVAAAAWVLYVARSKTAIATPFLGVAALLAWWRFGDQLRRHPGRAYAVAVAAVAAAVAAVVTLGLVQHGLMRGHFAESLDFRWKYWTASAGVFADHPVLGVGWANFGQSYLAHRVPEAAEEIRDPHDFLVRFAAELGTVGLLLVVAWLLRLAWETTRPGDRPPAADRPPRVTTIVWVAVVGTVLAIVAGVDFSAGVVDVLLLVMRPVLLLAAILLGGIAAALRTSHDRAVDDRPAPWVTASLLVGLGLFLLHNLIDFGWFEPGAGFAFMLLAGARLGMSQASDVARPRPLDVAAASGAVIAWVAVAVAVAVPLAAAAQLASAADDTIRSAKPESAAAAYRRAAVGYAAAADWVPYDADLWTRAARAAATGGDAGRARSLVATAVAVDPKLIEAHLLAADLAVNAKDAATARAAFDAAVRLDPNDVPIRVRYADALDGLGDRAGAAAQCRAALAADANLPVGEPRRLSPDDVAKLRRRANPRP